MRAQQDAELLDIHRRAGLVTPDGMPLVLILRARGHESVGRVCGIDLLHAVCKLTSSTEISHYFFGGMPGVGERLASVLTEKYPGLKVAGCYSPPFRLLASAEDSEVTRMIAGAKPHIVWVGLSTPKQEFWMRDHVGAIPGAILIGIGAAYDFGTGAIPRAPSWMQSACLEWLHRLLTEPRRLWKRYLALAPKFVFLVGLEWLSRSVRRDAWQKK